MNIDTKKVYYFITGDGRKVIGWDGWFPTASPDVYCNGFRLWLTRSVKDLYETEQQAIGVLNNNLTPHGG